MTDKQIDNDSFTFICCPPPCSNGERCREQVLCTPDTCPYGQKGWEHTAYCIKHTCAHDFQSGPTINTYCGVTSTCKCGMTAESHDLRYGP